MYRSKEQLQEETRICREADIMSIAVSLGIELRRCGSIYTDKKEDSVRIYPRTNSFYDFYSKKGGSPIDLVCRYKDCGVKEAVEYILAETGYKGPVLAEAGYNASVMPEGSSGNKPYRQKCNHHGQSVDIPEHSENNRRLFAYLNKTRGIDAPVIQKMLHEHVIYETKDRHNIAFVAKNSEGDIEHVMLRGTVTGQVWRGDTAGSNKDYGFSIMGTCNELVVFEAPIDLMSYMCLRRPERDEHLIALGMLDSSPIDTYLSEHEGISTIHFMLDNDNPGMKAAEEMMYKYQGKGFKCTNHLMRELSRAGCKDVNEYLCKRKGIKIPREASKTLNDKKHNR